MPKYLRIQFLTPAYLFNAKSQRRKVGPINRRFRVAGSEAHFRLQQPSDIPLLWAHFASSEKNWRGFECTRAKYNLMDNTIAACDIGIEIDFSRSDYTSAAELAQALTAVLKKHEIFCFLKFNIPAEALP